MGTEKGENVRVGREKGERREREGRERMCKGKWKERERLSKKG